MRNISKATELKRISEAHRNQIELLMLAHKKDIEDKDSVYKDLEQCYADDIEKMRSTINSEKGKLHELQKEFAELEKRGKRLMRIGMHLNNALTEIIGKG